MQRGTVRHRALHVAPRRASWKGRSLVAGTVVALGIGALVGSAYAYVTASGSGTGTGKLGSIQAIVVEHATGTPSTNLFPGDDAGLSLTLTNPNTVTVTVTGIAQHGTATVSGGTGCTKTNAAVTVRTLSNLSLTLANGTHTITVATGAAMGTGSFTGCQSATFHFPVTVTVHQ
jgi:hypothetical protein